MHVASLWSQALGVQLRPLPQPSVHDVAHFCGVCSGVIMPRLHFPAAAIRPLATSLVAAIAASAAASSVDDNPLLKGVVTVGQSQ